MKPNHNQIFGEWGENLAARWLTAQGLQLIHSRFRTPHGEIDIVMRDGEEVVFVEVKTRQNDYFGYPESAINIKKLQHLTNSAEYYFQQHPDLMENWRIDVISILAYPNMEIPDIQWFKNVHP